MRGLADESETMGGANGAASSSMDANNAPSFHGLGEGTTEPEAPPVEALTPPGSPGRGMPSTNDQDGPPPGAGHVDSRATADQFLATLSAPSAGSGADLLSGLAIPQVASTASTYPSVPPTAVPSSVGSYHHPTKINGASGTAPKKRKTAHDEDEIAGLGSGDALEGLDEDVAAMLRREAEVYR